MRSRRAPGRSGEAAGTTRPRIRPSSTTEAATSISRRPRNRPSSLILPDPARRHRKSPHHEGRRNAQGHVLSGPPLLRGCVFEPEHAAVAGAVRRLRRAAVDALGNRTGRSGALRSDRPRAPHDPGARRLPHPGEHPEAGGFQPREEVSVLIHVYGGPGSPIVGDRWGRDDLFEHLLVQQGYVVASFDLRSAAVGARRWRTPSSGRR